MDYEAKIERVYQRDRDRKIKKERKSEIYRRYREKVRRWNRERKEPERLTDTDIKKYIYICLKIYIKIITYNPSSRTLRLGHLQTLRNFFFGNHVKQWFYDLSSHKAPMCPKSTPPPMVLVLHGNSEYDARGCSQTSNLICSR